MYLNKIILLAILAIVMIGCEKASNTIILPEESVSFETSKDTIQIPLSILKDSAVVINFKAALKEHLSDNNHHIIFNIDSTKLIEFKEQYGDALLLPRTSFVFFKDQVQIKAGEYVSEAAELNIGLQTKLTEYSTYVLPVVIKSVDGVEEGIASSKTLFLVFKTGKPLFINRVGWTISAFSSQFNTFAPTNLIDNNDNTTYWASNITQTMPQWVNINFNKSVTFTGVNYYLPAILRYPTLGGYPTSIQIETSMDGVNWVDNGIYEGNIVNNTQTINIGETTARYLRFKALAAVKYSSAYDAIFISGISLNP